MSLTPREASTVSTWATPSALHATLTEHAVDHRLLDQRLRPRHRHDMRAGLGKRAGHRQFFAAAHLARHPGDDRAALDPDHAVAGEHLLHPSGCGLVDQDHIDALGAQRGAQGVMGFLHCGKVGHRLADPIPALIGIAETADLRHRLVFDDRKLIARPVHEHGAKPADIGGA